MMLPGSLTQTNKRTQKEGCAQIDLTRGDITWDQGYRAPVGESLTENRVSHAGFRAGPLLLLLSDFLGLILRSCLVNAIF